MSFKFSQKLIDETINCFREENGIELSPEKTEEYLDVFAKTFLAYARKKLVTKLDAGGQPPAEPL